MLGLSTYAYAWRRQQPSFTVMDVLDDAVRLGIGLVQICDLPELERGEAGWLGEVRRAADERGLTLETGTKGVEREHLMGHLDRALALGSTLVRSMLSSPRSTPSVAAAVEELRAALPAFERTGVRLGLETYEQYSSAELVEVVERVGSPALGIVLDPGNSVARLEYPDEVVRRCAPHVVGVHLKDFAFSRKEGMIGFTFAGAPLGSGLLPYEAMIDAVEREGRRVNYVIEHWLTRQETLEHTCRLEQEWVDDSVSWMRQRMA